MKRFLALLLAMIMFGGCVAAPVSDTSLEGSSSSLEESSVSAESSSSSNASTSDGEAFTFTDALNRTVTVQNPQKVAALMGSFAEVWLLAGGELVAVTEDAWDERPFDLPEDVTDLGSMRAPDLERMIALGTDFVLLSSKVAEHVDLKDTLEGAGMTIAYFSVETFEDYLAMLETLTGITGRADLYEKNGQSVREQVDAAIARSEGEEAPSVLYIRAYSSGVKAKGKDTLAGAMMDDLGCRNIADSDASLLDDLSLEKILLEDPDYIFVTTMGASAEKAMESVEELLTSNPAWNSLTAVQNDHYYVLPKELFHYKPNANWGDSYDYLADILYPEA